MKAGLRAYKTELDPSEGQRKLPIRHAGGET